MKDVELQTLRINALEREARRLLVESVGEDRAEQLYPQVLSRILFVNAVNPDELDIGEIVKEFTGLPTKAESRSIDQIIEDTLDREILLLRNDIEKLKSKTAAKLSAEGTAAKQLKGEAPAPKVLKAEKRVTLKGEYYPCYVVK